MRIGKSIIIGLLLLAVIFSGSQAFLLNKRIHNLESSIGEIKSTINQPILPFSPRLARYHGNPVLTKGAEGEWDQFGLGNPVVIWDDEDRIWKMWFYGYMEKEGWEHGLGYATSSDGLSWQKYDGNPILLGDEGKWDYMGFSHDFIVIKVAPEDYRLWYEAGPAKVEVNWGLGYATSPDGIHWIKYAGNPVIDYETRGFADKAWSGAPRRLDFSTLFFGPDRKFHLFGSQYKGDSYLPHLVSEDGIVWNETDGVFLPSAPFINYSLTDIAILPLGAYFILVSSVGRGFAYDGYWFVSRDMKHWDYGGLLYDAYGIEDETAWYAQELEFALGPKGDWRVYFATRDSDKKGAIGVGFLLTEKFPLTVLKIDSLAAQTTTTLNDCTEIPLERARAFALTVEAKYDAAATQGIKVQVKSSADGLNYDTEDWDSWAVKFTAGATVRQTKNYDANYKFVKVLVENRDASRAVTDVKVTVILVGLVH